MTGVMADKSSAQISFIPDLEFKCKLRVMLAVSALPATSLAAGIKPFSVCGDGRWHDYYIQLLRSNVSNVYPVAGGRADYCSALI